MRTLSIVKTTRSCKSNLSTMTLTIFPLLIIIIKSLGNKIIKIETTQA